MTYKILLSGATGAMGQMVAQAAKSPGWSFDILCGFAADAELAEAPARKGAKAHPQQRNLDFPIYSLQTVPEETILGAQVIIDFSHAEAVPELLAFARRQRLPLVLCTTGLSEETQALVEEAALEIPIFQSGNMSYGINLLEHLLMQVAPRLWPHFDIEIVERHHRRKVDAPSGTALMLASAITTSVPELKPVLGRAGRDAKRAPQDITIHAVRGGTIVGEHEVLFAGNQETLTFTHQAQSREVFAEGALRAAQYLAGKSAGLYNMHNLIAEESQHGTI